MYTTSRSHQEKNAIVVDALKPRNKQLHDVLSGRKGGKMDDKRKSRASEKQALRNSKDFQ